MLSLLSTSRLRLQQISLFFLAAFFAESSFSTMSSAGSCNRSSSSSSSSSSQPSSPLTCAVNLTNQWNGGYQINVKVNNPSAVATNKWTVVLDVPSGENVVSAWNAEKISQEQNSYTYGNLSWNGTIAPQGSTSFGANINYSGATHGTPNCRIYSPNTNHAPHASFRATIDESTVHAQTTEATDIDGDKLTYSIDFGDGKIINYQEAWHTYKTPGTYTITHIVSDGKASYSSTQAVTVTAPTVNRAPVAIFSYMSSKLSVQLNARASADPEGNPLIYSWEFSDGGLVDGTDRVTKISPNGGMLVTLTVFDGKLGDTVQVYAYAKCDTYWDVAPQLDFSSAVEGNVVYFDASVSVLADSFNWDFGDGTTASGMFATHTYAAAGTYTVRLSANGGMMGASKTTTIVVSGSGNHPPVADFTTAINGATVQIQSVNVSDADGDALTYLLDFGDGKSIKYPSAWHTYKTPGVYTITQTVSDGSASSVKTHQVTVTAASSNRAPAAVFSYYSSNLHVGVVGRASADFENSPLTFTWDIGNGPLPGTDVKSQNFTAPDGGTLVTLTVFDGELGDTVQVNVPARAGQSWDIAPSAAFTSSVAGKVLSVDASETVLADSFTWDFGDGTTGTGMFATHTYAADGTYSVTLRTGGAMMSNRKTVTVVVTQGDAVNLPPIAELTCNGGMKYVDDFVTHNPKISYELWCNADKSSDPEGKALAYFIEWGVNGPRDTSTTGLFFRSYPNNAPQPFKITVGVTDGINTSYKSIDFLPLGPVNLPPIAKLDCKEEHAVAGSGATAQDKYITVCDASASSDPEGKPLSYQLSWGINELVETSTTGKFTHTYATGGNYDLTLIVSDGVKGTYETLLWTASSPELPKTTTCEFHVTSEWSTGFTGWVRVKNNGALPINGWGVNLAFSGSNRLSSFWNAAASGNNPFVLGNLGWNATINPGAYVEFGFNGAKNGGNLETPVLSGQSCQ